MKTTKEQILFEAFRLFLTKGYDRVSMNDLVNASGLSKGAFYHYFSSKEELFRQAITAYFFTGLDEKPFVPNPSLSLLVNLTNLVNQKAELYRQMLALTGLSELSTGYFTLLFQAISMFPEFKETLRFAGSKEEGVLIQVFSIAQANGELASDFDSKFLAEMYSAMLDGMELHAVVVGDFTHLHNEEQRITEGFLKIICNLN
jgi:AcrR family transcriptional regulator